jgi:dTDP-4-dehydrorhamnose reductase
MKKVFGIGITGLVGSKMVELLRDKYEFTNLSIETGVDITNPDTLSLLKEDTEHDTVILLAAKADVDGCEEDKRLGEEGAAWKINVGGAQNVVTACQQSGKKLMYISTDFVFHGDDTPEAGYTADSIPHPMNWYGQTKYQAEEIVRNAGIPYCIVRIAYPYRSPFDAKKDFVQALVSRMKNNQQVKAITDHVMTPTFVDDFALAIDGLLVNQAIGIYHVVGSQSLTPFDAAMIIAKTYGFPTSLITETTREEFFAGRAPRPFNLHMNNDRIEQLGVKMRGFEEGLQALKLQTTE